ncbi:MAG: hypothetical protein AAGA62_01505 [Bacteroidota bacterium]
MSFIEDLVTLDVVTVTGDLRVKTNRTDDGTGEEGPLEEYIIDFKSLFGRKGGKTTVRGDLKVIAATHIEIDKDTLTFIGDELTEHEQELVSMHLESVTMAMEARAAIIARLLPQRGILNASGRLEDNNT